MLWKIVDSVNIGNNMSCSLKYLASAAFFVVFLSLVSSVSKYSADLNKNWHDDEKNPFRSLKMNQVWEKAKKRLSGPGLADLYADLHLQDKKEMELKRIIHDDMDKDGLKEAEVMIRFRTIMKKYNLLEQFKHLHSDETTNDIPMESDFDRMIEFGDKKMQKIWKKALLAGFNDDELEKLKTEFWHQQMKVDEYNFARDELSELGDISSNSLEGLKKGGDSQTTEEKNRDLKARHRKVKDGYLKLEDLSTNKNLEFNDPRVYQLWAMARNANMSEEELESFKKELKHFEHRIDKHDYMKDQVLISRHALRGEVQGDNYPEKHKQLEETADGYGRKVKKIHNDLKKIVEKAISRHSEL